MHADSHGQLAISAIVVESVTMSPPVLGWNLVQIRMRNVTNLKRTCVVNVEVNGGFWFQGRPRVFYFDLEPLSVKTFDAYYTCPSSARGKVRVSVSGFVDSYTVEQDDEGEPVGLCGARFVRLQRGAIEVYAQKGGHAEANAERVLAQRSEAIERVCEFLGVTPTDMTLVLYEKPEEKTFDTGHLGAGLARGTMAIEVFNASSELQPYHEIVHVQAATLGNPPAFLREGLAVYLEELFCGDALRMFCPYPTIDQAAQALRCEFWPMETLLALTDIGPPESKPNVAYPQAASVVKHLVDAYGRERVVEAYRRLQNGNSEAAVEENKRLLMGIFGVDLAQLEHGWLKSFDRC